ncbi:MAG: M42 family metallopeptidase [Clostridia bacterium]|nr:M42 family metallopeptidase [Clostridia bacterium]
MNKQLSYFTSLFGASGCEGDVRQAIVNEIRDYCEKIEIDALGNVIAFKRGSMESPFPVMLSAHMDEVALMVTHIDESGALRFDTVGGIDPRILPGKHVAVGRRKYHGVIGVKAPHLEEKGDTKAPKVEDLFIDIGAKDRSDAEQYVTVGDIVGFQSDYQEFGENLVRAKALDDRAGCYVLVEMIKKDLPFDVYFVFTTMEEIGCLGAQTAAYGIHPQYALILEGTTAGDIHTDANKTSVCQVGKGPVLSFMDHSAIYDREFFKLASQAAAKNEIPMQYKQAVAGGNESGSIQRTREGCKVLAVSIPCRYIHSPVSIASLDDIENAGKLALAILNELL